MSTPTPRTAVAVSLPGVLKPGDEILPTQPLSHGQQALPISRVDDWRRNRGLKQPRRRRRRLVELTRSFACIHPHCDKKYEAIRSLKHHLLACHGGVGLSSLPTVYNTKWHSVSPPPDTAPHSSTCSGHTLQASTVSELRVLPTPPHQSKLASSQSLPVLSAYNQQHMHSSLPHSASCATTTPTQPGGGLTLSPELLAASFSRSLTTCSTLSSQQAQQFDAQQQLAATAAAVQHEASLSWPGPWQLSGHFPVTTRKVDNDTQLMVAMSASLDSRLHYVHGHPSSTSLPSTNSLRLPAWQLLGPDACMPLGGDDLMMAQQQLLTGTHIRRIASADPFEALPSVHPSFLEHFDNAPQNLNIQLRSASAPLPDSPLINFPLDTQPTARPGHTCVCTCSTSRLLTPESATVTCNSPMSTLTSPSSSSLTPGLTSTGTNFASNTPVFVPGEPTQTLPAKAAHAPLRPTIARELLQDIYSDLVNLTGT